MNMTRPKDTWHLNKARQGRTALTSYKILLSIALCLTASAHSHASDKSIDAPVLFVAASYAGAPELDHFYRLAYQELAKNLDFDSELQLHQRGRAFSHFRRGKADVLAGRKCHVDIAPGVIRSKPIGTAPQFIFTLAPSPAASSLDQMHNQKIALLERETYALPSPDWLADRSITLTPTSTFLSAAQMLASGRVDAMITTLPFMKVVSRGLFPPNKLRYTPKTPFIDDPVCMLINPSPRAAEIERKINKAIDLMGQAAINNVLKSL